MKFVECCEGSNVNGVNCDGDGGKDVKCDNLCAKYPS